MNKKSYKIGLISLFCLFTPAVDAADLVAGKALSLSCQGCHGPAGISNSPQWPTLAGQTSAYLEAQLNKFKAGSRVNTVMKPYADSLSAADTENVAAYFASLALTSAGGDAGLAKQGKDKVAMCMGCHGEKLLGKGQFPRLAGQQPQYLAKQLLDFKHNTRQSGPMNALAASLTEDDVKAIAAYLGSLGH